MKISDTIEQFKRHCLLKGLRPKTYKSTCASLNMLIKFSYSEEIKGFNTGIISSFLENGIINLLWKPKTVHNHWQNLKSYFDWCLKNNFLKKNPVTGVEKPKLPKSLPRCLSREDAMKLLYYAAWQKWKYSLEKTRNEAIINTLIFSGIRLQELLNLEVTDVNLEDGTISVKQGKGGKDRVVPIHHQLMPKLRAYYNERKKSLAPSRWFFTGIKSSKKLYQKNVARILKVVGNSAGIKVTAHMLRHTFGKLMVEADFNIYKLKEMMGHEQVSTTQRYVSIAPESIRKSFEKINLL